MEFSFVGVDVAGVMWQNDVHIAQLRIPRSGGRVL
jgi:hypothetical protein